MRNVLPPKWQLTLCTCGVCGWYIFRSGLTEGNCNRKLSVGLEELEEAKLWKDSEGEGDSIKSGKTHVEADAFIPAWAQGRGWKEEVSPTRDVTTGVWRVSVDCYLGNLASRLKRKLIN